MRRSHHDTDAKGGPWWSTAASSWREPRAAEVWAVEAVDVSTAEIDRATDAQFRSWAEMPSSRSIDGGFRSRPAHPSAIATITGESKWASCASGDTHFWMIT